MNRTKYAIETERKRLMKKKWNVIAALLLAVVLVLPLAPKAAAAERQTVDPAKDTGSISLTLKGDAGAAKDVEITLYQVGKGTVVNNNLVFELVDGLRDAELEKPVELNGLTAEENIANAAALKAAIEKLQKEQTGDVVPTWSDSDYDYTETSYYAVSRGGSIGFERVPVDGSSKMDDALMESVEPFDFSDAVDFQMAYLAGYLADKYDVDAEQSIDRANRRIKQSTESAFAATVQGYATVTPESTSVRLRNGIAKYALYPVWILNTEWKGEKYTFAMNGQTGKFVGDLPLDKSAYKKWLFGLTGAIGAAVFAISYLFWLL